MKNSALLFFITPIVLSLLGVLGNFLGFINTQANLINFIISVCFIIFWLILFYFAPKVKVYSIHRYYFIWWSLALFFSMEKLFLNYLSKEMVYSWSFIFNFIFLTPFFGLKYPFKSEFIVNCIITGFCFLLFTIAICQMFIAKNMKNKYRK